MKFHLDHIPAKFNFEISHRDKVFLTGSCFAENIGSYLSEHYFPIFRNPYGILFNPESIGISLKNIIELGEVNENFIVEREGNFVTLLGHSSLKAGSKRELKEKLEKQQKDAHEFLKTAKCLIITFGSAFVYHHKKLNSAVGNCHKQAQSLFDKRLLEPEDILQYYRALFSQLRILNPNLKIILTVSPVKYLRDGLENHVLSKSVLILAVHKLVKEDPLSSYFPAYELLSEDLRDYRFYKEDLAHPNAQAIQYIWEKFSQCLFSPETSKLNEEIYKLQTALKHRDLGTSITSRKKLQEFIETQKQRILALEPIIRFEATDYMNSR